MQYLIFILMLSTCFLNCGCKPSNNEQSAEDKALSNTISEIRLKEIEETRKTLEELRKPVDFSPIEDSKSIEELNMKLGFNPSAHLEATEQYRKARMNYIEQQRLAAQAKREAHERRLKETEAHLRALLGVESRSTGPNQSPN